MYQVKINYNVGSEIVTLAEAKNYIRIETDQDDLLVTNMIIQARTIIENYISSDIMPKSRSFFTDYVEESIDLSFAPVRVISSISSKGVALTSDQYEIKGLDKERIKFKEKHLEDVQVNYETIGLNDEFLRQAVLQMVSTLYDNRSDIAFESINTIPTETKNLISSYRKMFF